MGLGRVRGARCAERGRIPYLQRSSRAARSTEARLPRSTSTVDTCAAGWEARRRSRVASLFCSLRQAMQRWMRPSSSSSRWHNASPTPLQRDGVRESRAPPGLAQPSRPGPPAGSVQQGHSPARTGHQYHTLHDCPRPPPPRRYKCCARPAPPRPAPATNQRAAGGRGPRRRWRDGEQSAGGGATVTQLNGHAPTDTPRW